MIIRFEKEYLEALYKEGKSTDKKHRYQPIVIKNYTKCVSLLSKVYCIEDLFPFHALRYEVLSGEKKGISSVRINDQYRLEFIVTIDKETEPIITICTLTEISNHYK